MTITEKQKQPQNLELLYAFKVQYEKAKRVRIPRMALSYCLALIAPFIVIRHPELKNIFSIIGGTWAVLSLICTYYEKGRIKVGAKIQDEFDTAVFEIEWNKILLGDHISHETIHNLNKKYKGGVNNDWYGNMDNIPHPFDVLICQRNNVVWDWRLRQNYFNASVLSLVVLFVAGICLSLHLNMMLGDYLKIILLPSSSAFLLGYKELAEHYDNIRAKSGLENKLNALIDATIAGTEIPSQTTLRQIQDMIYILRKCSAVVPDWFSKLYRKSYDGRMQNIIDRYKNKFLHA